MISDKKTHREVKKPQISARYLADFMAASETARRTIVQKCKYQSTARVIQHDEAKLVVSKYIHSGGAGGPAVLHEATQALRDRIADDEFDRDLFDSNADYIERFAHSSASLHFPNAERLPAGRPIIFDLNGVIVKPQIQFRLRRLARGNKIKTGAGMLRYAKGKALPSDVADWQSALLLGCLQATEQGQDQSEPEHGLCLTIDAYSGVAYPAPTDAIRRFQNMKSACASIAERWPNIPPPPKAVL